MDRFQGSTGSILRTEMTTFSCPDKKPDKASKMKQTGDPTVWEMFL